MTECTKCQVLIEKKDIKNCSVCKQAFCWLHSLPYEHDQICSSDDYRMVDLHGKIVESSDTANKVLKEYSPFISTIQKEPVLNFQCDFCDLFLPRGDVYQYIKSRGTDGKTLTYGNSCSKCYKVRGSPANWTKI